MKNTGNRNATFKKIAMTATTALILTLPIMAAAQNVSLNIKDATGTDKFVVTDTGFVGIGNNNPRKPIYVTGDSSQNVQIMSHCTSLNPPSSTVMNQGGGFLTYFNYPDYGLPQAGDRLGYYFFGAYQSDGVSTLNPAGIVAKAEQNWVSGTLSVPTYMTLETTDVTGGRAERVRITANGSVGIGTSTPGVYKLSVAGDVFTTGMWVSSDERLKKNITEIDSPLNKILKLKGHKYEFNKEKYVAKNLPEGSHYGVLAQELQEVLPEAVRVDSDGMESVAYTELIPLLIEAIKAQQKEINELKGKRF